MAVTENDRWALAFDVGGSVFNWKDAVKEALEEVCMVAVHPSDLLAAKQAGMGTAYSAPQLDEPDVPGMTLQELPPREAYDYYADGFEELADMLCQGQD